MLVIMSCFALFVESTVYTVYAAFVSSRWIFKVILVISLLVVSLYVAVRLVAMGLENSFPTLGE
jgi:hypothetical protein